MIKIRLAIFHDDLFKPVHNEKYDSIADAMDHLDFIIDRLDKPVLVFVEYVKNSFQNIMLYTFDGRTSFKENTRYMASHPSRSFFNDDIFYITPSDYKLIMDQKDKLTKNYNLIKLMGAI